MTDLLSSLRGVAVALYLFVSAGNVSAAAVPVESFAAQQTLKDPRISSNGSYLAVSADLGDDDHGIMVYRLADMANTAFIKLPKYELAFDIRWVSDTRLIYVKGGKWGAREEPFNFGEIIGMDFDGKRHRYLFGYKESTLGVGVPPGFGYFAGLPPVPNGKFYMSRGSAENSLPASLLYEVDALTGRSRLVADIAEQGLSFVMDAAGVPRYAHGTDKDEAQLLYAADAEGKNWRKLSNEAVGGTFEPLAVTPTGSHVIGYFSANDGPRALVKTDLALAQREVLASDDFNSIDAVLWNTQRQPMAAEFKGARPRVTYLDPASPDAKLHQELRNGFPDQNVRFVDHSADGNVSLIYIYSDRNPGEWAVMNRKKDSLARLLQSNAEIDPAAMHRRHHVRFKASDGLELDGYLTVPGNGAKDPAKMPMVLLPHGGPHGISDSWGFDTDAQFLASRGYLVLQVNYRGSGGRGYAFHEAGFRKWGTRIQDDLIDGMRWAVAQGYADSQRICVYGASFGAYSALMLAAKAPDLVKCVAGQAGLYDLRAMANKSDTSKSFLGRAYIARVIGRDDDELLANSPLALAGQIKVPVFLAHGQKDERTPIGQAEAMKKALEKAGNKPVWMSVPKEGHGFYVKKNVVAFYKQLEEFLAAHIGPK